METYTKLSKKFGFKEYLNSNKIRSRDIMARLRSGSNALRIDSGRRLHLARNERNCMLCREGTEDADHFLFICPTLHKNRLTMLKAITSADMGKDALGLQERIFGSSENPTTNTIALSHLHRMFNLREKILREDSKIYLWGR